MFKAWNILDSALNANRGGHHYWETKAVADELVARRADVRIFGLTSVTPNLFPGTSVHPIFSTPYYARLSTDPLRAETENLELHNQRFQHDLSQIDPSLFHGSFTFFPTLSERQLPGTIRWLAQFDDRSRPKTVITLEALWDWSETSFPARVYGKTWMDCPLAVKKDIALTVREPASADLFFPILGLKPSVLPSPLGAPERRAHIAANAGAAPPGPMVVAFVAGTRRERGAMLIPDTVKLCHAMDVRFFIQARRGHDRGFDPAALTALRGSPNVEVHEGSLDRDVYYDVISSSVVLLAYVPAAYQVRWSGVYAEAKFLGAPVIVAAGSWIAEDVKKHGNGVVFDTYSPAALAAAIATARRDIVGLRERAAILARKYNAENGPDRCVDALMSLFAI